MLSNPNDKSYDIVTKNDTDKTLKKSDFEPQEKIKENLINDQFEEKCTNFEVTKNPEIEKDQIFKNSDSYDQTTPLDEEKNLNSIIAEIDRGRNFSERATFCIGHFWGAPGQKM